MCGMFTIIVVRIIKDHKITSINKHTKIIHEEIYQLCGDAQNVPTNAFYAEFMLASYLNHFATTSPTR